MKIFYHSKNTEGNPKIVIGQYFSICLIINIISQISIIMDYLIFYLWIFGIPIFILQLAMFTIAFTPNPWQLKAEFDK